MNKAVFLDRDGVLNKSIVKDGKPYPPASIKEFEILPGVVDGIASLKSAGFITIVVTNQPDVGRGVTLEQDVQKINQFLQQELGLDDVFCCFHGGQENCDCRKPKPGMILAASLKWNIDLTKSYMIGDRWRDIEAAIAANVTSILIDYHYDEKRVEPDFSCTEFKSAVEYILNLKKHTYEKS